MSGENVELPEGLIQHIQSFLSPKNAARTSVISKLWYSAWSTHPILYLDDSNFNGSENYHRKKFSDFAKESFMRYKKHNLKLHSFILHMHKHGPKLSDKLISQALLLGATDITLHTKDIETWYYLPTQEFASSTSLKRLSSSNCKIDGSSRLLGSHLLSLVLSGVCVENDTMWNVLSNCPLIENLVLDSCKVLEKVVSSRKLKTFSARGLIMKDEREEKIYAAGSSVCVQQHQQYCSLISLELKNVAVDELFLRLVSHRFPCLEKLRLERCVGLVNAEIASNSIRYLSLILMDELRSAKIHVPKIRNFRFTILAKSDIPSLSFSTDSAVWESDLEFQMFNHNPPNWFSKITRILTELSSSKISLVMDFSGNLPDWYNGFAIRTEAIVENLKIYQPRWHSGMWSALFLPVLPA